MIAVNSYPELFTMLLGWQQYQNLWDILVSTGLVYVPFIAMIIKNTLDPFLSQEAKSAYSISLRRVEVSLAVMLITIMIGCQPAVTINPAVIHYQPVCNPDINATPGNSGTTYDGAFGDLQPVKVPLWWYAILSISHGITASATVGLGCKPHLREDLIQLDLSSIQSSPLRSEVKSFQKSCYLPAIEKFNEDNPDISQYTAKWGKGDTSWLGSHAFLNVPGYYDTFHASGPVVGFPYIQNKDWAQGTSVKPHSKWGAPSCAKWWSDPDHGLYSKLQAQIKPSLLEKIESLGDRSENASDEAIKKLLSNTFGSGYRDGTSQMLKATNNAVGGWGTGVLAGLGTAWESPAYFSKMYLLIEALPLIQAFLLMACYLFLAFAIPAAGFRFSTLMSLTFVIFSIIFWSYLWQLATWADSSMITALDPLGGISANGKDLGGTEVITDAVAVILYVLLPIFWSMFMAFAGVKAGGQVGAMIDRGAGISSAGAAGMGMVRGAISSIPKT